MKVGPCMRAWAGSTNHRASNTSWLASQAASGSALPIVSILEATSAAWKANIEVNAVAVGGLTQCMEHLPQGVKAHPGG